MYEREFKKHEAVEFIFKKSKASQEDCGDRGSLRVLEVFSELKEKLDKII